jgi:protein SCO1/2
MQIKVSCDFLRHGVAMLIALIVRHFPTLAFRSVRIALTIGVALLLAACGKKESAPPQTWHYEVRGLVRNTPPGHQAVELEHEDIPGFMPSMTMPFIARDPQEIAHLQIGDAISFRLNVTQKDSWIDNVRKIDANQLHLPEPKRVTGTRPDTSPHKRLSEGDAMPAFELRDQDGNLLTLESFRGRSVVVTFIFTRCPLPNFCPRMSENFGELQKAIRASSGVPASTRLLSISFDPQFDTPEILKQYAQHAGADPAIWSFATGEQKEIQRLTSGFSVLVERESGTINHGLATALIDGEGKIARIWRGNGWRPPEVMQAIEAR